MKAISLTILNSRLIPSPSFAPNGDSRFTRFVQWNKNSFQVRPIPARQRKRRHVPSLPKLPALPALRQPDAFAGDGSRSRTELDSRQLSPLHVTRLSLWTRSHF